MKLYELLELEKLDCSVAIIKNVHSKKMGKKDIIKIDADIPVNLDVIGYVDPGVSVNIIRDGELVEKKRIEMPETADQRDLLQNPRCISSVEQELPHIFKLTDRKNKVYRCLYCETKANPFLRELRFRQKRDLDEQWRRLAPSSKETHFICFPGFEAPGASFPLLSFCLSQNQERRLVFLEGRRREQSAVFVALTQTTETERRELLLTQARVLNCENLFPNCQETILTMARIINEPCHTFNEYLLIPGYTPITCRSEKVDLEDPPGKVPQGAGGLPPLHEHPHGLRHHAVRFRRPSGRCPRHRGRRQLHLRLPVHRGRGRHGPPGQELQGRLCPQRLQPEPRGHPAGRAGPEGAHRSRHHRRHRGRHRRGEAGGHGHQPGLPGQPHGAGHPRAPAS